MYTIKDEFCKDIEKQKRLRMILFVIITIVAIAGSIVMQELLFLLLLYFALLALYVVFDCSKFLKDISAGKYNIEIGEDHILLPKNKKFHFKDIQKVKFRTPDIPRVTAIIT